VGAAIVDGLKALNLSYPKIDGAQKAGLEAARKQLLAE
jgi:hypothetical protein